MTEACTGLTGHADLEPDACDDTVLIVQSLQAPERFAALFDRHALAIHRYVARRLGPDAADDLVAEAFLTAFRRRRRSPGRTPARGHGCTALPRT